MPCSVGNAESTQARLGGTLTGGTNGRATSSPDASQAYLYLPWRTDEMKLIRRDFRSMWACTYVEDVSPLLLNSRQTTFEWPQVRTGCDETRCDSRVVDLACLLWAHSFYAKSRPEEHDHSVASPKMASQPHNSLQYPWLIAHTIIGRYSSFSTHLLYWSWAVMPWY